MAMTDIRNFGKYLEELSGNNILQKKIMTLEKANKKLESQIESLKEEIRELKKLKPAAPPKKRGRKARTIIQVIEDEMGKKKDKTMKVNDILAMLEAKNVKMKAAKPYNSIAAALSQNKKFEKAGPGAFKLSGAVENSTEPKAAKVNTRKKPEKVPNYADSYFERGAKYQKKGDLARAIEDYTRAIQLDPKGETGKKASSARAVLENSIHSRKAKMNGGV
jgi:tetratricopeptide (TPR) repeat protein